MRRTSSPPSSRGPAGPAKFSMKNAGRRMVATLASKSLTSLGNVPPIGSRATPPDPAESWQTDGKPEWDYFDAVSRGRMGGGRLGRGWRGLRNPQNRLDRFLHLPEARLAGLPCGWCVGAWRREPMRSRMCPLFPIPGSRRPVLECGTRMRCRRLHLLTSLPLCVAALACGGATRSGADGGGTDSGPDAAGACAPPTIPPPCPSTFSTAEFRDPCAPPGVQCFYPGQGDLPCPSAAGATCRADAGQETGVWTFAQ